MATKEALGFAENLSIPKVQVIVMRANMSCNHCRQRVSQIISKMNGFMDYMVDLSKKEVTLRGFMETNKSPEYSYEQTNKKKSLYSFRFLRLKCFRSFGEPHTSL